MVAQNYGRGANSKLPRLTTLEIRCHFIQIGKERFCKRKQLFARRRQRKRPSLKEGDAQEFFELRHLRADCRLLDAIGNIAYRWHDPAMFGDIIKQFEVMNVHALQSGYRELFTPLSEKKQARRILFYRKGNGLCRTGGRFRWLYFEKSDRTDERIGSIISNSSLMLEIL